MLKIISALFVVLCPLVSVSSAQVYRARTDINFQGYPELIPCPGSSCAGGGALLGANAIFTPTDFNIPMIRLTDSATEGASGRNDGFSVDSSAEVNFMNLNDDRFFLQDNGTGYVPFIWNGVTTQATRMYVSSFPATNGQRLTTARGFPFWSFTQPYIAYDLEPDVSFNATLYSYDYTSTVTPPTRTSMANLTTCAPALAGLGFPWNDGITVSADDQTFLTAISSTSGQGSTGAVYVIVWNRTTGCHVWNTGTGAVTGAYGGASTGTIGITDRFTIHNVRLSKDGNWARVSIQVCKSGSCTGDSDDVYLWQISTLTVNAIRFPSTSGSGGHVVLGYTHFLNSSQRGGFGDPVSQLLIRPFSNVNLVTALLTGSYPPNVSPFGTHLSWANDVPADTAPVFITTQTNQFVPIKAWENEILASSTNGSGTVWRLGHTYATNLSQYFSAANAVGSVSQDGKWFAWATDWDGMLGNTNLSSSSCIVGVNCRTDVFIVQLPMEPSTPTPATKSPNSGIAPPTNVKATVN